MLAAMTNPSAINSMPNSSSGTTTTATTITAAIMSIAAPMLSRSAGAGMFRASATSPARAFPTRTLSHAHLAPARHTAGDPTTTDAPLLARGRLYGARSNADHHFGGHGRTTVAFT